MKSVIYNVLGAPGCGKGTMIKNLFLQDQRLKIVSMSGILMDMLKGPLGDIIQESMDSGSLVPTEIVIPAFQSYWNSIVNDSESFVLDGVIRTKVQAELCLNMFNTLSAQKFKVVNLFLDTNLEICEDRMKGRGRSDDQKSEVIKRRFNHYKAFTFPAIEYFGKSGLPFIQINGNQTPEIIVQEAILKIEKTLNK